MFTRTLDQASTLPAAIAVFYSALNVSVSVHHRISGQFFDPDCFSQSVFPLSTNIHRVVYASGYILGQISIFTSTAISVETRLLLMGLRYRRIGTLRRVRATIFGATVSVVLRAQLCPHLVWLSQSFLT